MCLWFRILRTDTFSKQSIPQKVMLRCAKVVLLQTDMFVKKHKQYDKVITILLLYTIACIEYQYHANIIG